MSIVLEKTRYCKECNTEITHKRHVRICNICRKTNKCLDCGKTIEPTSKRCKSCANSGKNNPAYGLKGKFNYNYKDGRTNKNYFCSDCGVKISNRSAVYGQGRCGSCNTVERDLSGSNNPNWKNGLTKIGRRIRNLKVYKYWHESCLERDKHTCQRCGTHENLEVHHKVSVSDMIKKYNIKNSIEAKNIAEFWMLENGITYCSTCHCLKDKARWFISERGE